MNEPRWRVGSLAAAMERRYHGIARIKAADGGVVGAGFLIAKGLVMTCAHNVTAALVVGDLDYPGYPDPPSLAHEAGRLLVDFPLAISEEDFGVVKIAAWYAPVDPEKSKKKLADVAVLELDGTPEGVSPVEFAREESYGRCPFKAYGVPAGRAVGTWAYGEIAEPVGAGLYEMHNVDEAGEQRDWFIEEGYSGSAAWSGKPDAVAGMIVFALGKRRAYMIPAEILDAVRAVFCGTQGHAERENIDLTFLIDRQGPLQHLATIRRQPDQRLLTFVIDGDKKQAPYDFLERIRLEGLLARFWHDESPEFFHVAWLEERRLRDPGAGLEQLVARAASFVHTESRSEDIRTAVNQAQEPFVFWSILRESAFGEDHLHLLAEWLRFWYHVAHGDSPGGPRLVRPVGVVICCEYGASAEAELPGGSILRRLFRPMRRQSTSDMRHRVRNELPLLIAPHLPEYLPELMGVPVPTDIKDWLNNTVRQRRPHWEDRISAAMSLANEVYKGCDELSMQAVLERVPRLGLFRS